MANKENRPPPTPGRSGLRADEQCTPPGSSPGSLGLRPWQLSAFASPPLRAISPNNRPALSQQRDHSACRRPDTPLKVRKTREDLKEASLYPDIPPPCLHIVAGPQQVPRIPSKYDVDRQDAGIDMLLRCEQLPLPLTFTPNALPGATNSRDPTPTNAELPLPPSAPQAMARMQRHKSVSRRMLTKVKQGISSRSRASPAIRPVESETSLIRRISGRRKQSVEVERRAQSFDISRQCAESLTEDVVDTVLTGAYPSARSFTDSTVSTNEILGDSPTASPRENGSLTPDTRGRNSASPRMLGSSPTEQTPRPPTKGLPVVPRSENVSIHTTIPYVQLAVSVDGAAFDAGTAHDLWVAVEATVCSQPLIVRPSGAANDLTVASQTTHAVIDPGSNVSPEQAPSSTFGSITSLRLCFRPADGCRLSDVVGQKALKDLTFGQTCSLFIKVHISELTSRSSIGADGDNANLFAELESIVGTLETEVLHVEARYRHSLLPVDNIVTVRCAAKIRRPNCESRWSIAEAPDDCTASSDEVHTKLAIHLADHYSPERALRLIYRCLGGENQHSDAVRQIRRTLQDEVAYQHADPQESVATAEKPSFVITDIDTAESSFASALASQHISSAPCTPLLVPEPKSLHTMTALTTPPYMKVRSTSLHVLSPALPASPSAAKALSSLNLSVADSSTDAQDAARKLWRHIRHSSLSAEQAAELAAEPLHQLEGTDEVLKELRRKALANKRSVGAETLRDWKWCGKLGGQMQRAEAPWL